MTSCTLFGCGSVLFYFSAHPNFYLEYYPKDFGHELSLFLYPGHCCLYILDDLVYDEGFVPIYDKLLVVFALF